jgi:hypothetical protein
MPQGLFARQRRKNISGQRPSEDAAKLWETTINRLVAGSNPARGAKYSTKVPLMLMPLYPPILAPTQMTARAFVVAGTGPGAVFSVPGAPQSRQDARLSRQGPPRAFGRPDVRGFRPGRLGIQLRTHAGVIRARETLRPCRYRAVL